MKFLILLSAISLIAMSCNHDQAKQEQEEPRDVVPTQQSGTVQ